MGGGEKDVHHFDDGGRGGDRGLEGAGFEVLLVDSLEEAVAPGVVEFERHLVDCCLWVWRSMRRVC